MKSSEESLVFLKEKQIENTWMNLWNEKKKYKVIQEQNPRGDNIIII